MTTIQQPRALYLAEIIEASYCHDAYDAVFFHASNELRRLHEVNAELLAALTAVRNIEWGASDGDICQIRINADAAITKAQGETE